MTDSALSRAIAELWRQSGLGQSEELAIVPCPVSGNNRVFLVRGGDNRVVAKWYCDGGAGRVQRDRLDAEWKFLNYAAMAGLECIPCPLARDDSARLALHSHRPGSRPMAERIGTTELAAAIDFFHALNRPAIRPAAAALPLAAEAAFGIAEHFAILDRRVASLEAIDPATLPDKAARALADRIAARWCRLRASLEKRMAALGGENLPPERRCVSPSDFGFHNTLLDNECGLSFIDFEYAGWDDPAKTICDFLLQPAVPIDPARRDYLVTAFAAGWPDGDRLAERALTLLPMFALKWCCIMLNSFVPGLARPGQFSDPASDQLERKCLQLAKAEAAFLSLTESD